MNIRFGLLTLLTGLSLAQVATQAPSGKLTKAYRYELVLTSIDEQKLSPSAPPADRVREAFVQKMGVIDLSPVSASQAKKAGWTYLLYTEGPMPDSDIQEILKTIGLRAARISLLSSPENPQKP